MYVAEGVRPLGAAGARAGARREWPSQRPPLKPPEPSTGPKLHGSATLHIYATAAFLVRRVCGRCQGGRARAEARHPRPRPPQASQRRRARDSPPNALLALRLRSGSSSVSDHRHDLVTDITLTFCSATALSLSRGLYVGLDTTLSSCSTRTICCRSRWISWFLKWEVQLARKGRKRGSWATVMSSWLLERWRR